jgi:hypothetical protein
MSLETGTVRAEEVTADMDMLCRGAWRPVLADAAIAMARNGRRARITVGRAEADDADAVGVGGTGGGSITSTSTVDTVAHSIVRVRPKQVPADRA